MEEVLENNLKLEYWTGPEIHECRLLLMRGDHNQ